MHNLRGKPDSYKRMFALSVSLLVTTLIVVVWISVIKTSIFIDSVEENEAVVSEPSPLSSLVSGVKRLSNTFSEGVSEASASLGKIKYKKAE